MCSFLKKTFISKRDVPISAMHSSHGPNLSGLEKYSSATTRLHSTRLLLASFLALGLLVLAYFVLRLVGVPPAPPVPGDQAAPPLTWIIVDPAKLAGAVVEVSGSDLIRLTAVGAGWRALLEEMGLVSQLALVCPSPDPEDFGSFVPVAYETRGQGRNFRLRFELPAALQPGAVSTGRYTSLVSCLLGPDAASLEQLEKTKFSLPAEGSMLSLPGWHVMEENHLYEPQANVEIPWFWERLIAPASKEVVVQNTLLDGWTAAQVAACSAVPIAQDCKVELVVNLWSKTQAPGLVDFHKVQVYLNDTLAAESTWNSITDWQVRAELPVDLLKPGSSNRLRLELLAPEQENLNSGNGYISMVFLDDFRLRVLPGPGSAPEIMPIFERPALTTATGVVLQPVQRTPDLRDPALAAVYLAIGPEELLEPLAPLLEKRGSELGGARAIPLQAIYDQFGRGLPEPDAIQAFLAYAAQAWPAPPAYLLLVGDYSYDPHNYLGSSQGQNKLPGFFIHTQFGGETISDLPYTYLDQGTPTLALGRLPTSTPEQVGIWVQKETSFVANAQSVANAQALVFAMADNFDASFTRDAETFLALFPAPLGHLYAPAPGEGEQVTSVEVAKALAEGPLFFAYFGHGSLRQLGKERLFTADHAAALNNPPTIMLNITCLAGLFTHPQNQSLAEVMLWNPNGGAVAALAATSLTTPSEQALLTSAFAKSLILHQQASAGSEAGTRLGAVVLAAQQATLQIMPASEVVQTFLLFGDPAMLIQRDFVSSGNE